MCLKKDREKVRYSKVLVGVILANTFAFSWVMLLVFYLTGLEPAILIEWYFKIIVGELGLMALSKIFELWKEKGGKNELDRNNSERIDSSDIDGGNLQDTSNG